MRKILIAVPFHRNIEWQTEEALLELEKKGCRVWRRFDTADLAYVRSEMCSRFEVEPEWSEFTHLLFVDSDVVIDATMVEKLANSGMDVIGGFCPHKDGKGVGAVLRQPGGVWPEWGRDEVVWLRRIGMYCTLISRRALAEIRKLVFSGRKGEAPYFGTMQIFDQMLSEDYSFCERCNLAGIKVCGHAGVLPGHLARIPLRLGMSPGVVLEPGGGVLPAFCQVTSSVPWHGLPRQEVRAVEVSEPPLPDLAVEVKQGKSWVDGINRGPVPKLEIREEKP